MSNQYDEAPSSNNGEKLAVIVIGTVLVIVVISVVISMIREGEKQSSRKPITTGEQVRALQASPQAAKAVEFLRTPAAAGDQLPANWQRAAVLKVDRKDYSVSVVTQDGTAMIIELNDGDDIHWAMNTFKPRDQVGLSPDLLSGRPDLKINSITDQSSLVLTHHDAVPSG